MKSQACSTACLLVLSALAASPVAAADFGARAVLQGWDPRTPDQSPSTVLADRPDGIGDALRQMWPDVQAKICATLVAKLGVGGLAGGETLHDIQCRLDDAPPFDVIGAGRDGLRVTAPVGAYLEASSTTPDLVLGVGLGRDADPRFSIAVTAHLDIALALQSAGPLLRATRATAKFDAARIDSHNLTGDVLAFVVGTWAPFFGSPDFKALAEQAIDGVSADIIGRVDGALAPLNAAIVPPPGNVRLGARVRNRYLEIAFGPPPRLPPTQGTVSGTLRWDPATFTPRKGCASFALRASVQTGPVPMFAPDPTPPSRTVGVLQLADTGPGSCAYVLQGVADGWPNAIASQVLDPPVVRAGTSGDTHVIYALAADGWSGANATPVPAITGRDYRVRTSMLHTPGERIDAVRDVRSRIADPLVDPDRSNDALVVPAIVHDRAVQQRPAPLPATPAVAPARIP
ncbi:MAG: hypothetical protein ABI538_09090 [Pseudoxanthomonas sp.]